MTGLIPIKNLDVIIFFFKFSLLQNYRWSLVKPTRKLRFYKFSKYYDQIIYLKLFHQNFGIWFNLIKSFSKTIFFATKLILVYQYFNCTVKKSFWIISKFESLILAELFSLFTISNNFLSQRQSTLKVSHYFVDIEMYIFKP